MADLSISPEEIRGALDSLRQVLPSGGRDGYQRSGTSSRPTVSRTSRACPAPWRRAAAFRDGTLGRSHEPRYDSAKIGAVLGGTGGIEEGTSRPPPARSSPFPSATYLDHAVDPLRRQ